MTTLLRRPAVVATLLLALMPALAGCGTDDTSDAAATTLKLPSSHQVEARVAKAVHLKRAPDDVQPPADAVKEAGGLTTKESRCDAGYHRTRPHPCVLGDPHGKRTIVLFGDSHVLMWVPAFAAIAEHTHQRLLVFGKRGCAPLLGIEPWHPVDERPYRECPPFVRAAVRMIGKVKPATIVLSGAFRSWSWMQDGQRIEAGEYDNKNNWYPSTAAEQHWDEALSRTLDALAPLKARTVMIGDIAYPTQDGADCLSAHKDDLARCTLNPRRSVFSRHNAAERATVRDHGATYVPVVRWLCTARACPPVIDGRAVYLDDFHLTRPYALELAEAVGKAAGLLH